MDAATSNFIDSQASYQPKDALGEAIKATALMGGVGLFVSAVRNSLAKQNVGAMGVFTRTGGAIGWFAAIGGSYTFTALASANLREKNDTWNTALGGFVAGAVMSTRTRTFPALFGYGAFTSIVLSTYEYTGGKLSGFGKDPASDEFERKEYLRRNRQRPITETVMELGEGRGIYLPGYEERRKERIKQAYGIDVNPSPTQET